MDCCLLCPNPVPAPPKPSEDDNATAKTIPDRGPLLPVHGTADSVHEYCADFAEGVFEVSKQYYFVARAISKSTTCSYKPCSGTGATSRCAVAGCQKRYHFMCAVYDGAIKVDDGSKFYCVDHAHKAPKLVAACDENENETGNININSQGESERENMEICFKCSNGGNLVCCDFCVNAVHQACAGLVEVPEGEYKCSVCTANDTTRDGNGNSDQQRTQIANPTQCTGTPSREEDYFTANERQESCIQNYSQGTCTPMRNTQDDPCMNGTSFMVAASPGCSDATISPIRDLSSPFKKTPGDATTSPTRDLSSPFKKTPIDLIDNGDSDDDIFNVDAPLNTSTQVFNPMNTEEKIYRKSPKLPKPPKQEGDTCFECGLGDDNLMPCDTCNRVVHPNCAGQRGIPISDFSCSMCTGETTEHKKTVNKEEKAGKKIVEDEAGTGILASECKQVSTSDKSEPVVKKAKSARTKKKKTKRITPKKRAPPKSSQKPSKPAGISKKADPSPKKRKSPKSITVDDDVDPIIDVDNFTDPSPKRRRASGNGNSSGSFSWNSWGSKRVSAFNINSFNSSQVTPTKSRYVLCATGLNEAQKEMLRNVARKKGTQVRDSISFDDERSNRKRNVTHMVINAYEETERPTRTIKLCKAVAAGIKLVRFKWISDALDREDEDIEWPDVEEYVHEVDEVSDTGKFSGLDFYFGTLRKYADKKSDLVDIVKLGGGTVLVRKPTSRSKKDNTKLILVEEANADKSQKKKGARRGSLSEIANRIAGAEIVEPQYILDQCVPQT